VGPAPEGDAGGCRGAAAPPADAVSCLLSLCGTEIGVLTLSSLDMVWLGDALHFSSGFFCFFPSFLKKKTKKSGQYLVSFYLLRYFNKKFIFKVLLCFLVPSIERK